MCVKDTKAQVDAAQGGFSADATSACVLSVSGSSLRGLRFRLNTAFLVRIDGMRGGEAVEDRTVQKQIAFGRHGGAKCLAHCVRPLGRMLVGGAYRAFAVGLLIAVPRGRC